MRVYIHGNCQASAIGWLLGEVRPGWIVRSREVHTFPIGNPSEFEAYQADVAHADLILAQPISPNYRGVDHLSLDWIRANKAAQATLLVFPSIHFRGYTIQSFALEMPGHLMDYHDVHVADMYRLGTSPEEAHARIVSDDFFTRAFVLAEVLDALREIVRREEACGAAARVSPILSRRLEREFLFNTFNHPTRSVLADVTEQLMRAAGAPVTLSTNGPCYLDPIRIMPYHSAARHLGLRREALPELGQVVRRHVAETLLDYVKAAYASYEEVGPEAVSAALARHAEAGAYLARFHGSGHSSHAQAFDASAQVESLYHGLLRRHPTPVEVRYWVRSLSEIGLTEVVHRFLGSAEYLDRNDDR